MVNQPPSFLQLSNVLTTVLCFQSLPHFFIFRILQLLYFPARRGGPLLRKLPGDTNSSHLVHPEPRGELYSISISASGTSSRVTAFNSRRTTSAENPARSRLLYREANFFSSSSPRKERSFRSMRWRTIAPSSVVLAVSSSAASICWSGIPRPRKSRAIRNFPCLRDSVRCRANCFAYRASSIIPFSFRRAITSCTSSLFSLRRSSFFFISCTECARRISPRTATSYNSSSVSSWRGLENTRGG